MISATENLLGIGLYTMDEAALYARITPRTVHRWVFGDAQGESVVKAQLGSSPEKIVTFLDFVQTMAIRSVRLCDRKFPLQKIRKACEEAAGHWNVKFPLAAKDHRIYLFGPRDNPRLCEMVIAIGTDDSGEEVYQQITGKSAGNRMLTTIAEPFMQGLKFGAGPFAEGFAAFERGSQQIVMDPHKRFGEPYLPSCGYTAIGLWEAYRAEGGTENAAKVYGVTVEEVELACSYFDYLTGNDAA